MARIFYGRSRKVITQAGADVIWSFASVGWALFVTGILDRDRIVKEDYTALAVREIVSIALVCRGCNDPQVKVKCGSTCYV